MEQINKKIKLLTFNSRWDLPKLIAQEIGVDLEIINKNKFADGEFHPEIKNSVRGKRIFLIQELSPAEKYMELRLGIDACRRASAKEINLVIPYFGWARQDRMKGRQSVAPKMIAHDLERSGATRIIMMDPHFKQLPSFFDIPADPIFSADCMIEWIKQIGKPVNIVAPDINAGNKADYISNTLNYPLIILRKKRLEKNKVQTAEELAVGKIVHSTSVLVDDIIDTTGTTMGAIEILAYLGSQENYLIATHGVLSNPANQRIFNNPYVQKVFVSNTTPETLRKKSSKIVFQSVHQVFAQVIIEIYIEGSIKKLFNKKLYE